MLRKWRRNYSYAILQFDPISQLGLITAFGFSWLTIHQIYTPFITRRHPGSLWLFHTGSTLVIDPSIILLNTVQFNSLLKKNKLIHHLIISLYTEKLNILSSFSCKERTAMSWGSPGPPTCPVPGCGARHSNPHCATALSTFSEILLFREFRQSCTLLKGQK